MFERKKKYNRPTDAHVALELPSTALLPDRKIVLNEKQRDRQLQIIGGKLNFQVDTGHHVERENKWYDFAINFNHN